METLFIALGRLAGRFVFFLKSKKISPDKKQTPKRKINWGMLILIVGGSLTIIYQYNKNHKVETVTSITASPIETITCWNCGKDITNRQSVKIEEGKYECAECYTISRKAKNEVQENEYATDGIKCRNCGLGHYRDGFCTQCGAASGERVNQSNSTAPRCEYCGGSGYVKTSGLHQYNTLCPSCRGRGKQGY